MQIDKTIMRLLAYEQEEFLFLYEKDILKIIPPTSQEWYESKKRMHRHIRIVLEREITEKDDLITN